MGRKVNKRRKTLRLTMAGAVTAAGIMGIVMLAKLRPVEDYIQKADYMKGETVSTMGDVVEEQPDSELQEETYEASYEQTTNEEKYEETTPEQKYEELTSEEVVATEKEAVTEEPETAARRSNRLNVKCVLQNPELPTGCEITALTIVLNYLGYDVDKLTMADKYLDKGPVGDTSPYKAFVGNPRDEHSCGAFAPVIVNSARKYLAAQDSDMNVYNVTGADYDELVDYVDQGHPVLVWETMWMAKPHEAAEWTVDGEKITWLSHEHAMVLIGYTEDTYIMADPLRGIYEYDKETVEDRYRRMGSQAIVIY